MTDGPPVTIAVVSANTKGHLSRCLSSMRADADAGRADVWVVDNASTDGSPAMVRDDFPWVQLIPSDENAGYGRAVNLVAEHTDTPWLVASNSDIELREGALESLLQAGESHPEAAAIAPRFELPDGSTQHSAFPFPTLPFVVAFNAGLLRLSRRAADRYCIEGSWDPGRSREVPWLIAAFLLLRRSAFDEVGRFDPAQFFYAEDLDLGWRLARAGWTARHEPTATVLHDAHTAGRAAFGRDLRGRWMGATYEWMERRRGRALARTVAFVNLVGAGLRWAVIAPLARLRPQRYGRREAEMRAWTRAHLNGLRSRAESSAAR